MEFPIPVSAALVHLLAVQVRLELGDKDQDLEEMADLCDELLNSDISIQSLTGPITDFTRAIRLQFKNSFEYKICSEKVTDCLQKAIVRLPGLHEVSITLARSLYNRFIIIPSDDDYKKGMEILDRILTLCRSGDGPYREEALYLADIFAEARFDTYGRPEDLEHAIYRIRIRLDGTSIEDPHRTETIRRLSSLKGLRMDGAANTQDALSFPSESGKPPSLRDLIASGKKANAIKPNSMKTFGEHLDALQACRHNQSTCIADIEDGLKYCRHLLVLYPRGELASSAQSTLCLLLSRAFELTHEIEYLNEGISISRGSINTADSPSSHAVSLVGLIALLLFRLNLLCQEEDFHELMQLFPTAADYSLAGSHHQYPFSCAWASTARRFGHPSASTAYEHTMSWMQASLKFSPTLDKQHSRLVATRSKFQTIPLDYASYHIDTGHLEQAIEALERGRGLSSGKRLFANER